MVQRLWLPLAMLLLLAACGGTSRTTTTTTTGTGTTAGTGGNNTGAGGGSNPGGSGTTSSGSVAVKHVVVVVFENADYSSVIGSSALPYLNQLAQQYSQASQFYADVHPSIGNYFWMTAGQDPSATAQNPGGNPDNYTGTVSGDNVASELTKAGLSWKVYAQSLPSTGYAGT